MSKQNFEKALRKELEVLNEIIDQKIVRGLSYGREAKRHRSILSSLSKIGKEAKKESGWLARSFSII